MQKHNKIKAFFFISIFSLLLLHQVLPHLHHQSEVEHTHNTIAHHNENHQHQHDTPKENNSEQGFLDTFLDIHIHSIIHNEIVLQQNKNLNYHIVVKKNINKPFQLACDLFVHIEKVEKVEEYLPSKNHRNPFLTNLKLRGPPILG